MPSQTRNPVCPEVKDVKYIFNKGTCKCILKPKKGKRLTVKKLGKPIRIKSKPKSPPKPKSPKLSLQSKTNLLKKYGAVVVKQRGAVITNMVGEKTINRAFELVKKLEKEDIKKVKTIANKAVDEELRRKGINDMEPISPQWDTSKWVQDLRSDISIARRPKLIKIIIKYSIQIDFDEELNAPTPKSITPPVKQTKRKRCPNGTKKNPKTGECEPKNKTLKAKPGKKSVQVIPSSTPQDLIVKGDLVMETIGKVKKEEKAKTLKKDKKVKSVNKSFRPSIYDKLDTIKSLNKSDEEMMKNYNGGNWPYGSICIHEAKTKTGKNRWYGMRFHENKDGRTTKINPQVDCSKFGSKWINYYLSGLKQSIRDMKKQSFVDKIVAPKQYQANCWFNTFFVVFFISDKGRSFSEYFRRLMIQGKSVHNTYKMVADKAAKMKDIPSRLHNALFRFNVMIHEALIGRLGNLDTNQIIRGINSGIPVKNRGTAIIKTGVANNPLSFYRDLMRYLDDDYVHMVPVDYYGDGGRQSWVRIASAAIQKSVLTYAPRHIARRDYDGETSLSKIAKAPDIIVIEVYDKSSKTVQRIPNEITVTRTSNPPIKESLEAVIPKRGKITYKLDAAIVRNTKQHHFCCCLTINGQDYAFDGVSHRRLQKYNWRKNLGEDKEWTFQGSEKMQWNFRQGYYMLFYYRTK